MFFVMVQIGSDWIPFRNFSEGINYIWIYEKLRIFRKYREAWNLNFRVNESSVPWRTYVKMSEWSRQNLKAKYWMGVPGMCIQTLYWLVCRMFEIRNYGWNFAQSSEGQVYQEEELKTGWSWWRKKEGADERGWKKIRKETWEFTCHRI